jgi:hypothetical protein
MAASSLPHYPDRPKRTQSPERNSVQLMSARRMTSQWVRVTWLVGIWGALFAFRSVVLSQEINDPGNTIVGTWEATDGSGSSVVFECGQWTTFRGERVLFRGDYKFEKDGTISTTWKTERTRTNDEWNLPSSKFNASVTGDELIMIRLDRSSDTFGIKIPDGAPLHLKRKR